MLYPVGTSSFQRIREDGYLYVDKTAYIDRLVRGGSYYFLARPRRFGKSILLQTLEAYFQGQRELFKGTEIDRLQPEKWNRYPVLHLNLSGENYNRVGALHSLLSYYLTNWEETFGVTSRGNTLSSRFYDIILKIFQKQGSKVVVLIDEYDLPLSDNVDHPQLQEEFRGVLDAFYSVLKKADNVIEFCMLTGVTRYGHVSVFSGLNNLKDITFDNRYAGICGITDAELMHFYAEGINQLAEAKGWSKRKTVEKLKFHYDGYHFSSSMTDVYNPYSINHALDEKELKDYWCASGVPTLLSKTLIASDLDIRDLIGSRVNQGELSDLSMYDADPTALFYQTGYLTLKSYDAANDLFTLGFPNREVERGMLDNILQTYSSSTRGISGKIAQIKQALRDGEPEKFIQIISSFLSGIPEKLHHRVDRYENYYHSILYTIVELVGMDIEAEYATSDGYIDILIRTDRYIYVIELKINGTAEEAIAQIEKKDYCAPFASDPRQTMMVGIGFDKTTGSVSDSIVKSYSAS